MEEKQKKYDFGLEEAKAEIPEDEDIHKKVDDLHVKKRADVDSAKEKAKHFEEARGNPPKPEYMSTDVFEVADGNGESFAVIEDEKGTLKDPDGKKYSLLDPIVSVDLRTLIDAQFAECPSNIMPMLIDEAVRLAIDEKGEFKPEIRKKDMSKWWWLMLPISMVPGIILAVWYFL